MTADSRVPVRTRSAVHDEPAASSTPVRRPAPARGAADPVKVLLHLHHDLCKRAVDPLEVAAGLEAAGFTDRGAARYRHRTVFSLAEEMYARVAHGNDAQTAPSRPPAPSAHAGRRPTRLRPLAAGNASGGTAHALSGSGGALGAAGNVNPASTHAGRPGSPSSGHPRTSRVRTIGGYAAWLSAASLPGVLVVLALVGLRRTTGWPWLAVAAAAVLATAFALRVALRHGPLGTRQRIGLTARAGTCMLLGYALLGDGLLRSALGGGPSLPGGVPGARDIRSGLHSALDALRALPHATTHPALWDAVAHGITPSASWHALAHFVTAARAPWPPATAPLLALALAVLPAACCARLFAAGALRRVDRSRDLAEFTTLTRPLLYGTVALYAGTLGVLLTLTAAVHHQDPAYAGAGALGVLLMLARLLMVHGFTRAPAMLLGAAGGVEALALGSVFAARLPGCALLDAPVRAMVAVAGPGAVPGAVCGTAALVLLAHAARTLTRASTHPHRGLPPTTNGTRHHPEGEHHMPTTLAPESVQGVAL